MRVSREQVAENRQKILAAASRLFRERGFDAVTVADVMKAAGLTHGGFYGYFRSKDDLIAQTLAHVYAQGAAAETDVVRYAANYLSPSHRDNLAGGCPTAALGAETVRQSPDARAAMANGLRQQIERLSRGIPGLQTAQARKAAIGSWSAMVGAVILARLVDDPALSDEVLEATRSWIGERNAPDEKMKSP
ncbi:TetR/AcrR family transcriptional regulator [Paraburkholderia caballeronis]|uniref:TetR/AcrR family transcriptional regulator n=1 Tax=Paraburkholderia caballeronis TaxID=416943 RepID=UPI001064E81F|nr:TetR/AcrR family transcriptional regulator [Paraburkholderia caballeronis]TDV19568.1 TetR family transcriptional regulator [Paraburkholderia caballeronis]TDV22168.1 TetR family transcriptional regulator [Paraburkholderia caballeronis]TDV29072.1 TetR family transcriptional regulator [Paraburkholderia caballeronis]